MKKPYLLKMLVVSCIVGLSTFLWRCTEINRIVNDHNCLGIPSCTNTNNWQRVSISSTGICSSSLTLPTSFPGSTPTTAGSDGQCTLQGYTVYSGGPNNIVVTATSPLPQSCTVTASYSCTQ
ncbi:hypothetical protein [Spirosoma gilvum]